MADSTERHSDRLSIGDLIAGVRILLLPLVIVAVLLATGHWLQGGAAPAEPAPTAGLSGLPREAWVWALLAYLAAIAPRHSLAVRLPGLPAAAKGLILALSGLCFWLETRYHDAIAPLLQGVLACALAAGCAVAAAAVARAERVRRQHAGAARDRKLEQLILSLEKQNTQGGLDPALTHPALFAEVGSILKAGSAFGTSIWFLRPHPALDHRRPIDVLREPGGEARLLNASRLGPNI